MGVAVPKIKAVHAHTANYTRGRSVAISRITFHHIVGDAKSALNTFRNPARGASSNYVIGSNGEIFESVAPENTAHCDGNWRSNQRTLSIEHAGGHPSVHYTPAMYDASEKLVAYLITKYGISDFKKHREVSAKPTACPGSLDVARIIAGAQRIISESKRNKPPAKLPATSSDIRYERLQSPKRVQYSKDSHIWSLNARKWSEFKSVRPIRKGDLLDVVGIAHHPLGGRYYMSSAWFGAADTTGRPAYVVGVNIEDTAPFTPASIPTPPAAPKPIPAPLPTPVPVPDPEPSPSTDPAAPAPAPPVDPPRVEPEPKPPKEDPPAQRDLETGLLQRLLRFLLQLLAALRRGR